jgi:membrane fusion protein (multidrug efflux system)
MSEVIVMESAELESQTSPIAETPVKRDLGRWLFPSLRVLFVFLVAVLAWFIAANWNKWTGNARLQVTQDAFVAGDVTPLSAKVSGYVASVAVGDYQSVRKGDLIVEIESSDYRAQLAFAQANLASSRASLANLANQRDVQHALVRQAEATIAAANSDLVRSSLELTRQQRLLDTRIASTEQLVEQADANDRRARAQLELSKAQLDQQNALLAGLDVQEQLLAAQVKASEAQVSLAQNNVDYTRIVAPADGLVGQRQVRAGQFVNVGTQVIAVVPMPNLWVTANYKETQLTNIRAGQPARVTVDAFPDVVLTGHVDSWSPGTGSTFALLPPDNATGNFTKVVQRVPVKVVLDANPVLGELVRPGMSVQATIDTGVGKNTGQNSTRAGP